MAQKKGGGSTRNGRDSKPKMLGVKTFGGELISAGAIIVRQRGTKFHPGVNVGVNKVRFPSPVPVGSLVRGTAEVMSVDEVGGGTQAVVRVSVTVDGAPKPSCVVDTVSRFFP